MRKVTRQVAFERTGWTPERARKVRELFDGMAPEWHQHAHAMREHALRDALERGTPRAGRCLEVGSGTGFGTMLLAEHFDRVIACDIAWQMLVRAPAAAGFRVQADGARLPLADASVDCVVLVNALLFPSEVERVLGEDGRLIWVNSLGDATPIHLPAADVAKALPGRWHGVASEAGWGTWCVLQRASDSPSMAWNSRT
jgi:ubiquinone/menaquinone biosynthesis C-methylase UbiE